MNIRLGPGALFIDGKHIGQVFSEVIEEIRAGLEEAKEAMVQAAQKIIEEKLPDDTDYLRLENIAWEREYWRRAAAFARLKMTARAQAFARQMEHQKARQVMKRRKMMHDEGHFPDVSFGRM